MEGTSKVQDSGREARLPFFTIGHSTRTIEEFVTLLRAGGVTRVIDIRTVRRSRRNPQYNEDALPASLEPYQIRYCAIPELGGLRKREREIPPEWNAFWENRSFHNYADYALTERFGVGLDALIGIGRRERCSIMCSEAVWWRCHRRLVTDYLILRGETVFHLMGADRVEEAVMTRGAQPDGAGGLRYPPVAQPA